MSSKKTTSNVTPARTASKTLSGQELGLEKKHTANSKVVAQGVRVLLQNWRQGTVSVKGRSDVAFSNKKPWKQKGTGRARAGSARSPLWIGGGVTHGPQPRTRTLRMPQKMRRQALASLLWSLLENDRIICLGQALNIEQPKTKMAHEVLREAKLLDHTVNLFVPYDDFVTQKSFANMPTVRMYYFDEPNIYDLASADYWVFFEKDLDAFKQMVAQWS